MLGCIQAHTSDFWLELIALAFEDDVTSPKSRFNIVERFQRCLIIAELPDEASTVHRRASGTTIRLLHIFIDCA